MTTRFPSTNSKREVTKTVLHQRMNLADVWNSDPGPDVRFGFRAESYALHVFSPTINESACFGEACAGASGASACTPAELTAWATSSSTPHGFRPELGLS
jgi:hypothetical protein